MNETKEGILRASRSEIEAAQSERLRAMLALCARAHPWYRERWADIRITAIRSVDDLERLPLTTKNELMATPEAFRLEAPDLPLDERILWEVLYTTGSTADPTPIYNTTHDYRAYIFQAQRVAAIAGIRDTDVIANLFPLTQAPMGAFVRSATNAYAAGAAIVGVLPGARFGAFEVERSIDDAVAAIERHRASVLWGVPSYLRRVLLKAIEHNADLRSVRMCALSGEATSTGSREELRRLLRTLGAAGTTIFDRYGATEIGAFAQCREDGDWHNPTPELQYHEIIDPATGRRLPDGERGALAVTHLDRRGTVLVRFVVGDVASIARDACPHCGRTADRLVGPIVRMKDLVKVKGMLINPPVLLDALARLEGIDEFQVAVCREQPDAPDELVVRVASRARDGLAERIVAATRAAVQVRPRVEFVPAETIYVAGAQTKAVRFRDERTQS